MLQIEGGILNKLKKKNDSLCCNKKKISWLKEGKQVVTKNRFLDTSLNQFMHFSLGNLGSDSMVTTCRDSTQDPNDFRCCRGNYLLNFSGNVSVARRGQTGGKATLAPCDVVEKHHLVSKQSEFELPVADKAFELV